MEMGAGVEVGEWGGIEAVGWGWHVRGRDYRLGGWMDVGGGVAVGEWGGIEGLGTREGG